MALQRRVGRRQAGRRTHAGPGWRPAVVIAAAAVAGLVAWRQPAVRGALTGKQRTVPPAEVLCGLDVSGSQSPSERRQTCGLLDQLVDAALPTGSRMRIWTFARSAEDVYDGAPSRPRDLWRLEDDLLKAPPKPGSAGTFPAAVLREMAGILGADRQGPPAGIVLMWDGEDADPRSTAPLAVQLARNPRLRAFWVAGIPANAGIPLRAQAERRLHAFGAGRLLVSGRYDAAGAVDAFRRRLLEGGAK